MSAPGDQCTGLTWTYDAWGNRDAQTATGGTCDTFQQTANGNNQLPGPTYQYDAAGNLTWDGVHTYYYDAEDRIIQVDGTKGTCSTATACYLYDAQGRRTQKIIGSNNMGYTYDLSGRVNSEWCEPCNGWSGGAGDFVYLGGKLIAEYADGTVYFTQTDHLGSTRILTGYPTPGVAACYDYYPFGEIISCGATGDQSQKFTDYLRDSETNLDDANARYFASALGRFMSPDWSPSPDNVPYANFSDPQTLNLYSYVTNNPLTLRDPGGHMWVCGPTTTDSHANGTYSVTVFANCSDVFVPGEHVLWGPTGLSEIGQLNIASPYANLKGRCSVPTHPATTNVNANIAAAQQHVNNTDNPDAASGEFGAETAYLYDQFRTGGTEDYKDPGHPEYTDFGNFNFGAVCGAMMGSLGYCQSAAGLGHILRFGRLDAEYSSGLRNRQPQYGGAGVPFLTPPFGDQPADSAEIAAGYAYQSAGCVQ
ncbi:MAG: RHS repeat-associated core domain-containing protein [Candidatus Acidiferrales bacterium]